MSMAQTTHFKVQNISASSPSSAVPQITNEDDARQELVVHSFTSATGQQWPMLGWVIPGRSNISNCQSLLLKDFSVSVQRQMEC